MSKFELLTVMEDAGQSDRLTIRQESYSPNRQTLKISITTKRTLVVEAFCPNNPGIRQKITAFDIDLDGLLQYLQEAKTFISEEEMIAKLMGK